MDTLILIRHGLHDSNINAAIRGLQNFEKTLKALEKYIKGKDVLAFASPARRATSSATRLYEILNIRYSLLMLCWSDKAHEYNPEPLIELVEKRREEAQVLLFVTHQEYAEKFPHDFARVGLEYNMPCFEGKISPGGAVVVHCNSGKSRLITYPQEDVT